MNMLFNYIFVLLTLFSTLFAKSDFTVEAQPRVIEAAQQIQQYGVLKQKPNGYLYVEVSREFIATILPMIQTQGKLKAPGHCTSKKGIGPHISVIYDQEKTEHTIGEIAELGKTIHFRVKQLRTVHVQSKNQKLWILACDAPDLEKLRVQYGLGALLHGHDFHITLATESAAATPAP